MNANHRKQMNNDMLLIVFYVRRKCSFHFTTFTHASEQKRPRFPRVRALFS
jgi:hypothetical protein